MSGEAKLGIAVAASVAVIALCLLAWIGGELHYRNCLQSVELRYPVASSEGNGLGGGWPPDGQARRDRAISSCSRWP